MAVDLLVDIADIIAEPVSGSVSIRPAGGATLYRDDGQIIAAVNATATLGTGGTSTTALFPGVPTSNDPTLRADSHGYALEVTAHLKRAERPLGNVKPTTLTWIVLVEGSDTVELSALSQAEGLPPVWVSIAEMKASLDAAVADAEAAALLAQQAQAAALEVPDANVSALIGNPASDTRQALDGTYEPLGAAQQAAAAAAADANVSALIGNPASDTRQALDTYRKATTVALDVRDYGAAGDGTTDDRAAIQAALDAAPAGATVTGRTGDVYALTSSTSRSLRTTSGGTNTHPVCLVVPSGVTLDLSRSTLRLTIDAIAIANSGAVAGAAATTSGGIDVVIDGGNAGVDQWLTHFTNIDGWTCNIRARNVTHGGVLIFNADNVRSEVLDVDGCAGQPYTIGTYTANRTGTVRDSTFGRISARNVTPDPASAFNFPGNAFYGELVDSTIDAITGVDCSAGVKIATTSTDLTVGRIETIRCGNSTGNSGVKLQGDFPAVTPGPQRVTVGTILSKGSTAQGLYLHNTIDCTVTSYTGEGNGTDGAVADVWIAGARDTIGTLRSAKAGQSGVLVRAAARDARVGTAVILNAGQVSGSGSTASMGFNLEGGASASAGSITVIDDQPTATTQRGLNINSGATFHADHVEARGMSTPLNLSGSESAVYTPRLGTGAPYGEVTLAAGATTTTISSSAFFLFGAAHVPIVDLVRLNGSARALSSLYWRCTSQGVLTLRHAAAVGGEVVSWRLVGYRAGGTSPA